MNTNTLIKQIEAIKATDGIFTDIDFRDDGYAFKTVIKVFNAKTGELICEKDFMFNDDAQSFIGTIENM